MKLILENWEHFLKESDFDTETGEPITARGRELESAMIDQAIKAEKACDEWARENYAKELANYWNSRSDIPINQGRYDLPP